MFSDLSLGADVTSLMLRNCQIANARFLTSGATSTGKSEELNVSPFADRVGEDIATFVVKHAPRKVATRIARGLDHYKRAPLLIGVDEGLVAIHVIAAGEELIVATFK